MNDDLTTTIEDFDYHIPAATLFFYMVGQASKGLKEQNSSIFHPFLIADNMRKQYWEHKLHSQSSKPKIGICWTSAKIDKIREQNYTSLEKWQELLSDNKFSFINLTYSVSMDEIRSKGAITQNFLDTGFLDQKDDLDGVAALISNLDYVISASSSPSMFSSALGIPTLIFGRKSPDYLGRSNKFAQHPIFKNTKLYPILDAESDKNLVPEIKKFLEKEFLETIKA
jgi:ADP-heptose:LPS heptosyltransferase